MYGMTAKTIQILNFSNSNLAGLNRFSQNISVKRFEFAANILLNFQTFELVIIDARLSETYFCGTTTNNLNFSVDSTNFFLTQLPS